MDKYNYYYINAGDSDYELGSNIVKFEPCSNRSCRNFKRFIAGEG